MKTKILTFVLVIIISSLGAVYSQDNTSKPKPNFYTEIFLGPGSSNILSTGVSYKGFYVFGQVLEYEKDYNFGVGALYDGMIGKNVFYRLMGSYSEEFFGYGFIGYDFGIPYFNPQPTLTYMSDYTGNIGLNIPVVLSKNLTIGFWFTKDFVNKKGFELGPIKLEIDLYITF